MALTIDDYRAPPAPDHQDVACELLTILRAWARRQGLGKVFAAPLDVYLSRHDVVQPDLFYIAKERLTIIREDGIYGAPDLVVEVLSPATARIDRTRKMELYRQAGAKEAWLVEALSHRIISLGLSPDTEDSVRIWSGRQKLVSPVLPGFEVEVSTIFDCASVYPRGD